MEETSESPPEAERSVGFDSDPPDLDSNIPRPLMLPSAAREPTFRDFGDQIKALTQENFQLRLRIYMHEKKNGGKMGAGSAPDGGTQAATIELAREFHSLKQSIESYQMKLSESENRSKAQEAIISDYAKREDLLLSRNKSLAEQLDVLDRELALARLNQRTESDEVERCFNAFHMGGDEEGLYERAYSRSKSSIQSEEQTRALEDLTLQTKEQSRKIQELTEKAEDLSLELRDAQLELDRRAGVISQLEETMQGKNDLLIQQDLEITKLREKQSTCFDSLRELGFRYTKLDEHNAKLEKEIEELRSKYSRQAVALDQITKLEAEASARIGKLHEKESSIRKVFDLFQSRVTELIGFMEGLLELEARKLPVLDTVIRNHRETITTSLKQTQLLSETVRRLLCSDDLPLADLQVLDLNAFNTATLDLMNFSPSAYAGVDCPSPRTRSRPSTATKATQCASAPEHGFTSAQAHALSRENCKLEEAKNRLTLEKGTLYARVATLEANLNAMKDMRYPLQIEELNRKIEKLTSEKKTYEKYLRQRDKQHNELLTEREHLGKQLQEYRFALTTLQKEYGNLVKELSDVPTGFLVKENYEKYIHAGNPEVRPQDSSPDLGIESGHDAPSSENILKVNNGNSSTEDLQSLRVLNKDLATKLKQTKHTLDKTLEKLNRTTKEKEQVEKAICRQLHKTHTILRQAKRNLETPGEPEFELELMGRD